MKKKKMPCRAAPPLRVNGANALKCAKVGEKKKNLVGFCLALWCCKAEIIIAFYWLQYLSPQFNCTLGWQGLTAQTEAALFGHDVITILQHDFVCIISSLQCVASRTPDLLRTYLRIHVPRRYNHSRSIHGLTAEPFLDVLSPSRQAST